MTTAAKQLLEQVMAIDVEDRAELIDRLTDTIEPSTDPEYIAAWEAEIKSRRDDIDSGRAKMIPAEETIRLIRKRAGCDEQAS